MRKRSERQSKNENEGLFSDISLEARRHLWQSLLDYCASPISLLLGTDLEWAAPTIAD